MTVFGIVVQEAKSPLAAKVDEMLAWMTKKLDAKIERRDSSSYEALAQDVRDGKVDVAWLPPIVYVRLADAVVPLGS